MNQGTSQSHVFSRTGTFNLNLNRFCRIRDAQLLDFSVRNLICQDAGFTHFLVKWSQTYLMFSLLSVLGRAEHLRRIC